MNGFDPYYINQSKSASFPLGMKGKTDDHCAGESMCRISIRKIKNGGDSVWEKTKKACTTNRSLAGLFIYIHIVHRYIYTI